MVTCTFHNLTKEQAQHLARWYEAQGEQSCEIWFDINEVPVPDVDVHRDDCITTDEAGNVHVQCITSA